MISSVVDQAFRRQLTTLEALHHRHHHHRQHHSAEGAGTRDKVIGVRALNTFSCSHPSMRMKQVRTWFQVRGREAGQRLIYVARQYDFVLADQELNAQAGIHRTLKPTDHYPLLAIANFNSENIVHLDKPTFTNKGWRPSTWRDEEVFKRIMWASVAQTLPAYEPALFRHLEASAQEAMASVQGLPGAVRRWQGWQPGTEEKALKFAWRTERATEERRRKHDLFEKVREERLRKKAIEDSRSLARTQARDARLQAVELDFVGSQGWSKETMDNELLKFMKERYAANDRTRAQKEKQLRVLWGLREKSRRGGFSPPALLFADFLRSLWAAQEDKAPGEDDAPPEAYHLIPWRALVVIYHNVVRRVRGSWEEAYPPGEHDKSSDPVSWKGVPLNAIPKEPVAHSWGDFRWIATTPVGQKWFLRCVMVL